MNPDPRKNQTESEPLLQKCSGINFETKMSPADGGVGEENLHKLGKPQQKFFLVAWPLRSYTPQPLELSAHIFFRNFFSSFNKSSFFLVTRPLPPPS